MSRNQNLKLIRITQQSQINQANTLQAMQGAAGGSGIGVLAQSLYNQGAKTSQQIGAGIGQQERANQLSAAQQEATLQSQKAQGKRTFFVRFVLTIVGYFTY